MKYGVSGMDAGLLMWFGTAYCDYIGLNIGKCSSPIDNKFETTDINIAYRYFERCYEVKDTLGGTAVVKEKP